MDKCLETVEVAKFKIRVISQTHNGLISNIFKMRTRLGSESALKTRTKSRMLNLLGVTFKIINILNDCQNS